MRVCENGHYVGDATLKSCGDCGGKVTTGHKVSLFLPDDLWKAVGQDARIVDESLSAQIVRHVIRDRDRKRPRAARTRAKAKGA
jgi:rRNA maturation protein Nop10